MAITGKRSVRTTTGRRAGVPWLLLMFRLPARAASQRVNVWRKLQKFGALGWRNSGYILPNTPAHLEKLQWLRAQVLKSGGEASVAEVARMDGTPDRNLVAAFNAARGREYDALADDLQQTLSAARNAPALLARLHQRFAEIREIDTFHCGRRAATEALLRRVEALGAVRENAHPRPTAGFRGRTWMTRPRPEVDRVGSAWLIRHFIDPRARFVFSTSPATHPGALRFDMFEGEFTHVGEDCSFETLCKQFRLRDRRLRTLAQIVHDADLKDNKYGRPEGIGFEQVFKGWGQGPWRDAEILKKGFEMFDGLYRMLPQ
ncbi:MAG: chromate resistance protein ChrB domain-containing protein [Terriglobales bacterium]